MAEKKKTSMAKQVAKDEKGKAGKGEQMDLIDVGPEHSKELRKQALVYKAASTQRQVWTKTEADEKVKFLEMVRKEKLKRLPDGTIKFKIGTTTMKITPRDELVQVTEDKEE